MLQVWLGHRSLTTTSVYLHVAADVPSQRRYRHDLLAMALDEHATGAKAK